MLRRDQQMRMQIHQLVDACIFAVSFWLAYELRTDVRVAFHLGFVRVEKPFENYVWVCLVLILITPLILEGQGFYNRPVFSPRRAFLWPLFKSCVIVSLCVVLALFLFREIAGMPRWAVVWFGGVAVVMVYLKEEIVRMVLRSNVARAQYIRRFILVGEGEDLEQIRAELRSHLDADIEVVGQLNLNQSSVEELVAMLHEHSVNGVIVSAKHVY